jgi:hypothetical protein
MWSAGSERRGVIQSRNGHVPGSEAFTAKYAKTNILTTKYTKENIKERKENHRRTRRI